MRLSNISRNKEGFTIIELLIVLSILLIVISLGYSFYFYFVRSFEIASKQSNVQENVRLAKNIIDNKVRHASYIKIGDAPVDASKYNQRIFLNNHKIMDEENKDLLNGLSDGVNLYLTFEKKSVESPFLWIEVKGSINGDYEYVISSEVLILGIENHNFIGTVGQGIYYYSSSD